MRACSENRADGARDAREHFVKNYLRRSSLVSYPTIMRVWFPKPDLKSDEVVLFQAAANLFRGKRAIGGRITVTDQRLLFVPNRLDGLTGGSRVDVARSAVGNVRTTAASKQTIRPQVEIEHSDGTLGCTCFGCRSSDSCADKHSSLVSRPPQVAIE